MASIPGLPDDVKEILEGILEKDPTELTQYEVDFLNARRWVLNARQRVLFASVLIDASEEEKQGIPRSAHTPQDDKIDPNAVAPNKVTGEDGQIADDHKDNAEDENKEEDTGAQEQTQEGEKTDGQATDANSAEDKFGVKPDQFDPSAV